MLILSLSGCYSDHVVLMLCFVLKLSMVLIYCIVPLVLGVSSFVSLVVEDYTSFYFLNCIAHVWQVI